MIPFGKILCPIDFTESSYEALKAANELALHFSAELFVLHVVSITPIIYAAPAVPVAFNIPLHEQEREASSRKLINDVIHQWVSKELHVYPMVVFGEPAHQIAKTAEEKRVDLIVMTTHEKTGW